MGELGIDPDCDTGDQGRADIDKTHIVIAEAVEHDTAPYRTQDIIGGDKEKQPGKEKPGTTSLTFRNAE